MSLTTTTSEPKKYLVIHSFVRARATRQLRHNILELTQPQYSQYLHFGCQSILVSTDQFQSSDGGQSRLVTKPLHITSSTCLDGTEKIINGYRAIHMHSFPPREKCLHAGQEKDIKFLCSFVTEEM